MDNYKFNDFCKMKLEELDPEELNQLVTDAKKYEEFRNFIEKEYKIHLEYKKNIIKYQKEIDDIFFNLDKFLFHNSADVLWNKNSLNNL